MMSYGMPEIAPHELKLDTRGWQRYGPKKKAYYRIMRKVAQSGREYFVGAFGFKGNGPYTVEYEGAQLTPAEIADLARKRELAAAHEARRRAIAVQRAADQALDTWRAAAPVGRSPYLDRKLVPLEGGFVRYLDDLVIVPMTAADEDGRISLRGVQVIRPSGEKRFTTGMAKTGCAAVLGWHVDGAPLLICEGLATAASCWLALNRSVRVVVAFDAQNLLPVAQRIRARYPAAPILVAADDDFLTEGNPGRSKASQAARRVDGCGVTFPVFRNRGERKLTDFNDLHCTQGLDEVRDQLQVAMRWLGKF